MESSTVSLQNKEGLHVLDSQLPFIASEAAIDIDNLLSNRAEDLTAIHLLAKRLKYSIEVSGNSVVKGQKMDAATLSVLSEAIIEIRENQPPKNIDDLLGRAEEIASILLKNNLKEDLGQLKRARDFCLAFSKATAAYLKSIRDLSPTHPYRK